MSIVTRRWYIFRGPSGFEFNASRYDYVEDFPNNCQTSAPHICAVLGVYSIFPVGGSPTIFGDHPRTFAADLRLSSYITQALASSHSAPASLPGQKKYVYVKNSFW